MVPPLSIPVQTTIDVASLPAYAHPGDAGLDLRATKGCVLKPFERALIPTGLRMAIPEGYAGLIMPRSGLALKQGFTLVNTPGLIDSNYRGELGVIGINLDCEHSFTILPNDRIAQLVIVRVEQALLALQASFDDNTERGTGGFGSSGV
ncbi:MAG: dUTP diphosphatase [Raoultibacter sp.]